MRLNRFIIAAAVLGALTLSADNALAQRRGGGHGGSLGIGHRTVIGRAVPAPTVFGRGYRPVVLPSRVLSPVFYGYPRSFFYGPRFSIGIGLGYGYPFGYYGYGYYPYGYPYLYPAGYYGYGYYGYPYGARRGYGGVRIDLPDKGAEVWADGYYVGIVDDFDGTFQRLELPAGPHRIEVRGQGAPPLSFDVNVVPGETVHYRGPLP